MGVFLIVVGAIIRYALNVQVAGIEEATLGLILIIAGIVAVIVGLVTAPFRMWSERRARRDVATPTGTRPGRTEHRIGSAPCLALVSSG